MNEEQIENVEEKEILDPDDMNVEVERSDIEFTEEDEFVDLESQVSDRTELPDNPNEDEPIVTEEELGPIRRI